MRTKTKGRDSLSREEQDAVVSAARGGKSGILTGLLQDFADLQTQRDDLLLLLWAKCQPGTASCDPLGRVTECTVELRGRSQLKFSVQWKDGYPTLSPKVRVLLRAEYDRWLR